MSLQVWQWQSHSTQPEGRGSLLQGKRKPERTAAGFLAAGCEVQSNGHGLSGRSKALRAEVRMDCGAGKGAEWQNLGSTPGR